MDRQVINTSTDNELVMSWSLKLSTIVSYQHDLCGSVDNLMIKTASIIKSA